MKSRTEMPKRRIFILTMVALSVMFLFMSINLRGNILFALELRSIKLLSLVQVAIAIALSTVVFQTITNNRILTPSIMGMDALYLLLQTVFVFILGGLGFAMLDPAIKFYGEVLLMVLLVVALFLPLLRFGQSLQLLLLTGIIFGILFRSLSSMIARLIDPNDFAVVQGVSFANFNSVNEALLAPALLITILSMIFFWRHRYVLDVLLLGRTTATSLGVNWRLQIIILLMSVGLLVSVATALVGPVTFLGLLVVALTDWLVKSRKHGVMFITSCLLSIILVVGGQVVLEHLLDNTIILGVVIEFVGGLLFLILLMTRRLA